MKIKTSGKKTYYFIIAFGISMACTLLSNAEPPKHSIRRRAAEETSQSYDVAVGSDRLLQYTCDSPDYSQVCYNTTVCLSEDCTDDTCDVEGRRKLQWDGTYDKMCKRHAIKHGICGRGDITLTNTGLLDETTARWKDVKWNEIVRTVCRSEDIDAAHAALVAKGDRWWSITTDPPFTACDWWIGGFALHYQGLKDTGIDEDGCQTYEITIGFDDVMDAGIEAWHFHVTHTWVETIKCCPTGCTTTTGCTHPGCNLVYYSGHPTSPEGCQLTDSFLTPGNPYCSPGRCIVISSGHGAGVSAQCIETTVPGCPPGYTCDYDTCKRSTPAPTPKTTPPPATTTPATTTPATTTPATTTPATTTPATPTTAPTTIPTSAPTTI